ncbi:transglycosylase family protein [Streptomyces halobius]|uniref:transglycosylase family protein n=1 Tax=Streptomyces halobius TaxID=2879846 RepID=UPI0024B0FD4D|nr:transglycosylase family protein [Streptomyces halobius]
MTGAGLAMPLLGAGGAHAADTATWDRVAQCESGGMWSAASGNGFYGGLQLTREMWDEYGGRAYASRPDLASRSQQITVAEKILADRGPDAWPSCAVNAGLTQDGRAPEVDPGGTSAPIPDPSDSADPSEPQGPLDPSGSTGGSGSSDDSGASADPSDPSAPTDHTDHTGPSDPSDDVTPSPSVPGGSDATDPSDPSNPSADPSSPSEAPDDSSDSSKTPDPSDSPAPGDGRGDDASQHADPSPTPSHRPTRGRHRGDADDREGKGENGAGDGDRPSGRHASRGDGAHRTPPAADGEYTVRPGDSLSAIAAANELPGGWPALYDRNKDVIGSDADLIRPGQLLDLGD